MKCHVTITSYFFFTSVFSGRGRCPKAALLILLNVSMLAAAQIASSADTAKNMVAMGMSGTTRHTEKLQVPRKGKANLPVQAEFSGWVTVDGSRETTIPARGFYLVTLMNDSAVTVINGEEKQRTAGEIWAVPDGQSMTIKIPDPRQENITLEILSIRPAP